MQKTGFLSVNVPQGDTTSCGSLRFRPPGLQRAACCALPSRRRATWPRAVARGFSRWATRTASQYSELYPSQPASRLDNNSALRYYQVMIRSFRDKEAERIFFRQFSRRFPRNLHRAAWRKLAILDAADRLEDLYVPPGNHLEKLSGDRRGQHSIRINDQWRICFRWRDGDAYEVEITDYH